MRLLGYDVDDSLLAEIDKAFIKNWLNQYDPVTRYTYAGEVDRKRSRFFEAVVTASQLKDRTGLADSCRRAEKLWNAQMIQYLINARDEANEMAMTEAGVR